MRVMKGAQVALLGVSAAAAMASAVATNVQAKGGTLPETLARLGAASVKNEEMVSSLVVKPRVGGGHKLAIALARRDTAQLSKMANASLTVHRPMSGGAHVLKLDKPVTLSEARVLATRLMQDGSVEFAEPDRMVRLFGVTPSDPRYTDQWNYKTPTAPNIGGANLPDAWHVTFGTAAVTVAVLDTGILPHADFTAANILPGYDFISNGTQPATASIPRSNDGDGRDADATDPGDFVLPSDSCYNASVPSNNDSLWHGTHVAGTLVAAMNGLGGAGIAPNVKLLPVRVLGSCGGTVSDMVDGMRWAAGLHVPNVPPNPNPAHILNMSLGVPGVACSPVYQSAVNDVLNAGKTIFAATGNESQLSVAAPANCAGVIAVTAHAIDGDSADYANIGPETAISGPGGGCGFNNWSGGLCNPANSPLVLSTYNSGATAAATDNYDYLAGTSMATPHAAGVAALMLSIKALTSVQIKSYLQSSARAFPATSSCVTNPTFSGKCGAGLLDAYMAVAAVNTNDPPPVATVANESIVAEPVSIVSLNGSAASASGRLITAYGWTQLTGAPVAINNANTANATFIAPATGTYSFKLTATDTGGKTGTATAIVLVDSRPVPIGMPDVTVAAGATVTFTVKATDADGDTPIYTALSLPEGATLSAAGVFHWPNAGPAGDHVLTYIASDTKANSDPATVSIKVTGASGGGGGSLDGEWLIGLGVLALGLRTRRMWKAARG